MKTTSLEADTLGGGCGEGQSEERGSGEHSTAGRTGVWTAGAGEHSRERGEVLTPAWWLGAPPCSSGTCSANAPSPLRSPPAPSAAPAPGLTSSASQPLMPRGPKEGRPRGAGGSEGRAHFESRCECAEGEAQAWRTPRQLPGLSPPGTWYVASRGSLPKSLHPCHLQEAPPVTSPWDSGHALLWSPGLQAS